MKIKNRILSSFTFFILVCTLTSCIQSNMQSNSFKMLFEKEIKKYVKGDIVILDNSKTAELCGYPGAAEIIVSDFNGDGVNDMTGIFLKKSMNKSGKLEIELMFAIIVKKTNTENKINIFPISTYSVDEFDSTNISSKYFLNEMNYEHTKIMTKGKAVHNSSSLFVFECNGDAVLYYYDKSDTFKNMIVDEREGSVE